jgi:hypothetical protein
MPIKGASLKSDKVPIPVPKIKPEGTHSETLITKDGLK